MTIQIGDRIPEVTLQRIREGVETLDTDALFEGRNVVLFAVPGAFTPTCSEKHLPGFVQHFDEFRSRGIDVACMAVNDPFVMQAWGESQGVPEGLLMLADGSMLFSDDTSASSRKAIQFQFQFQFQILQTSELLQVRRVVITIAPMS